LRRHHTSVGPRGAQQNARKRAGSVTRRAQRNCAIVLATGNRAVQRALVLAPANSRPGQTNRADPVESLHASSAVRDDVRSRVLNFFQQVWMRKMALPFRKKFEFSPKNATTQWSLYLKASNRSLAFALVVLVRIYWDVQIIVPRPPGHHLMPIKK